jgi:protein phosphatase
MINDEQILGIVSSTNDTDEVCKKLIKQANENGGEDNITALVVRFDDQRTSAASLPPPSASEGSRATQQGVAHGREE